MKEEEGEGERGMRDANGERGMKDGEGKRGGNKRGRRRKWFVLDLYICRGWR